jgi:hypothetical protein
MAADQLATRKGLQSGFVPLRDLRNSGGLKPALRTNSLRQTRKQVVNDQ